MQSDEAATQDGRPPSRARAVAPLKALHASLPLDIRAPRAARNMVDGLEGRIAPSALVDAQLVVSELVANSVRHSGAPATEFVEVSLELTDTAVRVEVADPGRGGVIAPREGDAERDGGFGLNLVLRIAELWGLERAAGVG